MRVIICRVEWIKRVLDVFSLSMITQAKPPSDVVTWIGFQMWIKNQPVSGSLRFLFNVCSEDGSYLIVAVKSPAPPPLQSVWKKTEKMKLGKNTNTKSMAYPSKRATAIVPQPPSFGVYTRAAESEFPRTVVRFGRKNHQNKWHATIRRFTLQPRLAWPCTNKAPLYENPCRGSVSVRVQNSGWGFLKPRNHTINQGTGH